MQPTNTNTTTSTSHFLLSPHYPACHHLLLHTRVEQHQYLTRHCAPDVAMSDLDELFARLKAQSSDAPITQPPSSAQPSIWAQPEQERYQNPSVSSPLFSPPINTPDPIHSSRIISPVNPASSVGTPALSSQTDQNRTNNLLNLLKFNNQSSQPQAPGGPMANLQNVAVNRTGSLNLPSSLGKDTASSRPLSAQDLVASLQRHPSASAALPSPLTGPGAEKTPTPTTQGTQQDFLLNLLKRPNAGPSTSNTSAIKSTEDVSVADASVDKLAQSFADASMNPASPAGSVLRRESTPPVRHFGSPDVGKTAFEAPHPTKASIFNYQNPFEQLHAASPLNRTPKPESQAESKPVEILKHNRDASAQNGQPLSKSRKVEDTKPEPTAADDGKSQSVAEALEGVGETVDKQVEEALGKVDAPSKKQAATAQDGTAIKKETVDDEVESSWESAEDSASEKKDYKVKVYNLPMKPFVSLTIISPPEPAMPIRQDNFIVIAQAKKEFDQMDRCLVTASQSYIVYAQAGTKKDNSGFRVLRQDSGAHKQVFKSSGERIFNVQICGSPTAGNDVETVLGTGINGSVYWTSLAKSRPELFEEDDVEQHGFFLPAVATAEEATSGSAVKTRAKCSSRHPEYFALSRGKTIHLISPPTIKDRSYTHPSTRKANNEKYLAEHGLRINTGKAGKDFCFSEDDTMIVSLDKSGTVKFWDIRDLAARATDASEDRHEPVELKEPMWTLTAVASGFKASEKPSVSSIMLLDKERPHIKGVALRYMLVGFKQNHILQLWDLGLMKPVQELRLPHESDADGICSIAYHPKSGILAIGHPTRNSIYFVHLSAPKYSVPFMDQSRYVNLLARKDAALPKPQSTAIMSGLREFSLDKVGTLRSLDMLRTPVDNASEKGSADETLFELYVMHSKGTVCVAVKRADLGWNSESRMVNPIDAVKEGVVEVEDLPEPPKDAAEVDTPVRKAVPGVAKKQPDPAEILKRDTAPATNGATAPEDKPNMQIPEAPVASQPAATNPPLMTADSYAMAAQRSPNAAHPPSRERAVQEVAEAAKAVTSPKPVAAVTSSTQSTPSIQASGDVSGLLSKQFDSLYHRLDSDKRVSEAAGAAKQDAMLRLVSTTLTENVERSLSEIIGKGIEERVIPSIADTTSRIVDKKLSSLLPGQIQGTLSKELKGVLPTALQQALREQSVQKAIADSTASQVASKVQQQVSAMLAQSLPNMAQQASQKMVADLESRMTQRLHQAETQHQQDNAKIEELSELVRGMSQTLQGMAESYSTLQEQILGASLLSQGAKHAEHSKSVSANSVPERDPQVTAEEEEVNDITQALMAGKYQEATLQWLQSARQAELFDKLFVRVNPQYLQQVGPLITLSVCAVVSATFDSNIDTRLTWLNTILEQIDVHDQDIVDMAPRIMDVLSQRLQGVFITVSERSANDPLLRRITTLSRRVGEVRRVMG